MNKEFLSGTLSTLILSLLMQNGSMYGYEICKLTKELSDEEILLTEGAIYPALHKLEHAGVIDSYKQKVNGRTRKYYRLRESELARVKEKIRLLNSFTQHVQNILKPAI